MLRVKFLRLALLGWASLFCLTGAFADSLALPAPGKIEVLDLGQIRVVRSIELKSRQAPLLAGHPGGTVLASLTGDRLVFWNLPGFSEASSGNDELYQDVVAMEFSVQGDRLFLLSRSLKSVLAYSLASAKVESVYPLPGGEPIGLQVGENALWVRQKDGLAVLEPASGALLAQFRLGAPVVGVLGSGKAVTVSVEGRSGLQRFALATAEPLAAVGTSGTYGELQSAAGEGFLAVGLSAGVLECWSGAGKLLWATPLSAGPHALHQSTDRKLILAVGSTAKMVSVIETATGRELGKLPVAGLSGGGVLYRD